METVKPGISKCFMKDILIKAMILTKIPTVITWIYLYVTWKTVPDVNVLDIAL